MELKFNLYDFFGYLIPGVFLIGLINWTWFNFHSTELIVIGKETDQILAVSIIAYFLGHLIQVFGKVLEILIFKKVFGKISKKIPPIFLMILLKI